MNIKLPRPGDFSFKNLHVTSLGLVASVVTLLVAVAVFAVASLGLLNKRYEMSGVFSDSGGVRVGDAVRVAGLLVGSVKGVDPDYDKGQVIITWKLDQEVDLGPETSAEIAASTLLGGHYVRLSGPVQRPYMSSLPKEKRRIPLERTVAGENIYTVFGNATRAARQIDTGAVNDLLHQLADITEDNGAKLDPLLKNLAAVSVAISDRDRQLRELLGGTQRVTATLATKDQALAQLVDQASVFLDEIVARRDQLATLLGTGNRTVTGFTKLIQEHRAQIDAIIDDLHIATAAAGRQLPEINHGLAFIGPTFTNFTKIGAQGPWLDVIAYGLPFDNLFNFLRQFNQAGPAPAPGGLVSTAGGGS
jgi:phospholipid/cholesterol/gamma-HCH transport system substrate-binding protein